MRRHESTLSRISIADADLEMYDKVIKLKFVQYLVLTLGHIIFNPSVFIT